MPSELAEEIKEKNLESVEEMTTQEERTMIPNLYMASARFIEKTKGDEFSKDGFLLSLDDPFSKGALRTYKILTNQSHLCLPVLLPFNNSSTEATLNNYILRALGGGDFAKAEVAREAIEMIE